jgi:hypothetical protein
MSKHPFVDLHKGDSAVNESSSYAALKHLQKKKINGAKKQRLRNQN